MEAPSRRRRDSAPSEKALSGLWSAQVCRSLFEAHKLLFSFLMTIKIMMGDDRVDALEWRFCISGQTIKPLAMENPADDWIEANTWSVTQRFQ